MMWKKGVALLFGLMLISAGFAFGSVSAGETTVTVILVSDNEADGALAQYIANLTGAVVVTTQWGVYDPNVTAEIISHAPDEVIIIGGPDAVVDQYIDDLQEFNITTERWWGRNRYETNMAVIGNATVRLGLRFGDDMVVVPGNDTAGIREAIKKAMRTRAVIIFANESTDVPGVIARMRIHPRNVTVVGSAAMERIAERVMKQLAMHGGIGANVSEVRVNITAEMAMEAINMSEQRVATAEEMMANVTLPPQMEKVAERMLDLAKEELKLAKEAYTAGNYGRAYGQAIAAKAHAEFAIRMASREWQAMLKTNKEMGLEIKLRMISAQLEVLKRSGVNVSEIETLVDAAKKALEQGDIDAAHSLLMEIRMSLKTLYLKERLSLRRGKHVPFGGHGAP
ncbi:cell wall-binding repeat-containing protein [Thermococcus sp. M36]|uniref:cell wall-binding repeat-containing protein n=1 Tax=Thermococcus sp. M36 TaxID=1638261 RepID=UPI00197F8992|nr:hypothetical protein [Thermococcus sp. M36]